MTNVDSINLILKQLNMFNVNQRDEILKLKLVELYTFFIEFNKTI